MPSRCQTCSPMSSVSLPPVPIYGPTYFLFIISSVSPSRVSWLYSRCPSLILSIYSVFCPMFPVGCYICSLWSCLCSIKNLFVKEFHVSSFCAGPAAHRVHSVPAAHRVRSVPAAQRVRSVPAAHRVINGLHMSFLQAFFYEHPHKHVLLHYIVVRNVLKRTVRSFFLSAIKHANNIQYLHKN